MEQDDNWDRGRSSLTHSKLRISEKEDPCSRSRDADYGKGLHLQSSKLPISKINRALDSFYIESHSRGSLGSSFPEQQF